MSRILVIEDDETTAQEIVEELRSHGHEVVRVGDGPTALGRASSEGFDVITLDRMLPEMDGMAVVFRLRESGIETPILMISALSDVDERIAGLRAGGDDYLVKPFSPSEMAMRVEVLLRRQDASRSSAVLRVGDIEINLIRRTVKVAGESVKLLHMEFKLLEFLARHRGEVMSRRVIFEKVWEYYFDPGANLINVHVARLRKKLDRPGQPSIITTVKGEGYRFDAI